MALSSGMHLQCLLVTRDHSLLEQVKPALESFRIEPEFRSDASSALSACERRHLDGFMIDCDDLPGGPEAMVRIRNSSSNRLSTIFAVVNGVTGVGSALEMGASFVLAKPVSNHQLHAYLKIGRVLMEREHRRYFRYPVDLPVQVEAERVTVDGRAVNISEGGLAMRISGNTYLQGTVRLNFALPSIEAQPVEAKGDVVWTHADGVSGVRFLHMPDRSRQQFEKWMAVLHSQREFHAPEENATGIGL